MTPKEKAADIYYRFWDEAPHYAKQCALIAADMIIASGPTRPLTLTHYENSYDMVDEAKDYWQQVKTEIENF